MKETCLLGMRALGLGLLLTSASAQPFNHFADPALGGLPQPTIAKTAAVTGATIGSLRNDIGAQVGFIFTPTTNMTVTHLGRYKHSGNSTLHTIQIRRTSDCTVLGSVVLNASTGTAGTYQYESLVTPVTLTSGTQYAIFGTENTTDLWSNDIPITTTGDFSGIFATFSTSTCATHTAGASYGPYNFLYTKP